jgi:hypothetical protein
MVGVVCEVGADPMMIAQISRNPRRRGSTRRLFNVPAERYH